MGDSNTLLNGTPMAAPGGGGGALWRLQYSLMPSFCQKTPPPFPSIMKGVSFDLKYRVVSSSASE